MEQIQLRLSGGRPKGGRWLCRPPAVHYSLARGFPVYHALKEGDVSPVFVGHPDIIDGKFRISGKHYSPKDGGRKNPENSFCEEKWDV